jgi:hypothetical protein
MPTFSALNGQVKTPLRWYTSLFDQHRHSRPCKQLRECDYAIFSRSQSLPPFQLHIATGVTTITSWKLYNLNDEEVADITNDRNKIIVVPFVGLNYLVYPGTQLIAALPTVPVYSVIVAGGVSYYSEIFKPLCPAAAPIYNGPTGVVTIGDGGIFSEDLAPDADWSVTRYAYLLTGMYSGAGAPTDPTWAFEGSQAANLTTGDLWTYTAGVWVDSRPPGEDYDTWYNEEAGTQHSFDGVNWVSVPPPIFAAVSGDVLGFYGQAYQPIAIGRNLDEIECVGRWVRFTVQVGMTAGTFHLEVWDQNGQVIAESDQTDGLSGFAEIDAYIGATGYTFHIVAGEPDAPAIMDVFSIETQCADDTLDCHIVLEWSSCGNVGNTYYEEGFTQELILPTEAFIRTPEPTTEITVEEDANNNRVETFRRTEVEYTIDMGYLPWHVVDALAQVPLHETINLVLDRDRGTTPIMAVRFDVDWDEVGAECFAFVVMTFQIDEAAVTAGCCTSFDAPCIDVCVTAAGLEADGDIQPDQIYLLEDGTYATSSDPIEDPLLWGNVTDCPLRFARVSTDTGVSYWYYRAGEWRPAAEFIAIEPINCEADPATYTVSAYTMPGYSVRLDYTDIDSGTWTPITDQLFTQSEMLAGVEVTPPSEAVSIRLTLIGAAGCLMVSSRSDALPCACLLFSFNFTGTTAAIDGDGGLFVAAQLEPIEAQVQIDGAGPWIDIDISFDTLYSVNGAAELGGGATYQYRVRSAWRTDCDWTLSEVRDA